MLQITMRNPARLRDGIIILLVAVAYVALGWLASFVSAPTGERAAIWPAAGLALAALVRFGYRVWPGVFAGSVAIGYWLAPQSDSLVIPNSIANSAAISCALNAAGATLQALLGAALVRQIGRASCRERVSIDV